MRGCWRLMAVAVVLSATLSCRGASPRAGGIGAGSSGSDVVVVASFNFPESELLAEIYADALQYSGIPVRRELDLGPRELVRPALQTGLVDVVPEYLGTALTDAQPDSRVDVSDPVALRAALAAALVPWHLHVLAPAAAQDQNGLAVTRSVADRLRLRTVSDLRPLAGQLTLGGPAECPSRPYCLLGYRSVYGLQFKRFLAFDDTGQRVAAIEQQVIDVAVMFTTDAPLTSGDLVLLTDDRRLQPADNVVPVVSSRAIDRYGPRLTTALDEVSSHLTSNALAFVDWRVVVGHNDVAAEAKSWLQRQGLIPR